jgi:hypothetical protein
LNSIYEVLAMKGLSYVTLWGSSNDKLPFGMRRGCYSEGESFIGIQNSTGNGPGKHGRRKEYVGNVGRHTGTCVGSEEVSIFKGASQYPRQPL